ncbi:unnamed protein product [Staurois parvus]|uniref:Uncharacterized protein n=1 Tax=Staurois parvus TaxID=386267 RepID=A0ABN9FL25_9NEOB|nr:unnamed protein product [Staurois parvus]
MMLLCHPFVLIHFQHSIVLTSRSSPPLASTCKPLQITSHPCEKNAQYSVISLVISCTVSAVSGHLLYCVRSLWSSPVLCPQSLVISCTVSAVTGHLLYCVRSLWSSPVLCPQSLVISCTVSAVSGHLLYCVRSLW